MGYANIFVSNQRPKRVRDMGRERAREKKCVAREKCEFYINTLAANHFRSERSIAEREVDTANCRKEDRKSGVYAELAATKFGRLSSIDRYHQLVAVKTVFLSPFIFMLIMFYVTRMLWMHSAPKVFQHFCSPAVCLRLPRFR